MRKCILSAVRKLMNNNPYVSQTEINICNELLQEAETLLIGKFGADNLFQNIALGMAGKTVKSFRAIVSLAELGLGEPATIILRSIFEDLVNLKYIEEEKEGLGTLFVEYNFIEARRFLDAIEEFDPEYKDLSRLKKHFTEKIEPEYLRVKDNYPQKLSWSRHNLRERAKKVDDELAKNYAVIYRYSSSFVHGSPTSVISFLGDAGDGERNLSLFQPSTSEVAGTIALAFSLTAPHLCYFGYYLWWSRRLPSSQ